MSDRRANDAARASALTRLACGLSLLTLAACAGDTSLTPSHVSEELRACHDAATGADVTSIASAVAQINALPPMATVPCFVAALPRPLDIVATNASVSAQPAQGDANPRMFLLLDGVAISVVPDGDGAPLVEFGEWMSPTHTLKGEVHLPLTTPLSAAAPFERVRYEFGGTSCGLCHAGEAPHPTLPNAFVSVAYQPSFDTEVYLQRIEAEHDACVDTDDPSERCAMFHALMDFGDVRQGAFADDVAVFGQ